MNPHRVNIINILQLISSPAEALECQRQAPGVRLASELVNHWFDDFYHPGSTDFQSAFSSVELAELARFHSFFNARADALPDELARLLGSPAWEEVSSDARAVLDRLSWAGLVAEYDRD